MDLGMAWFQYVNIIHIFVILVQPDDGYLGRNIQLNKQYNLLWYKNYIKVCPKTNEFDLLYIELPDLSSVSLLVFKTQRGRNVHYVNPENTINIIQIVRVINKKNMLRCVIPVVLSQNNMHRIMCVFTYTCSQNTTNTCKYKYYLKNLLCFDCMYM